MDEELVDYLHNLFEGPSIYGPLLVLMFFLAVMRCLVAMCPPLGSFPLAEETLETFALIAKKISINVRIL